MKNKSFEIKVAVVGYVSVGKSTLLNGLFGKMYSDVKMKRSTAAVNHFRIASALNDEDESNKDVIRSATSTLKETRDDNEKLRNCQKSGASVQEKEFTIVLDKPLCDMLDNTSLVFVDIPGMNEANGGIYKKYVKDNWHKFDCVIVVMDATQGANTDQQVNLLENIRDNIKMTKKVVPVIVVGNKVDDPHDEELSQQVHELRDAVMEVFKATALQSIHFVPISAQHAFVCRWGSQLKLEEFQQLDKELIDKIGREELGLREWRKLYHDREKQVRAAYYAITSTDAYGERMKETNFENFLSCLSSAIGGSGLQTKAIEQQQHHLLVQLLTRSPSELCDDAVDIMRRAYDVLVAIDKPYDVVHQTFWKLYNGVEEGAFSLLEFDPDVSTLGKSNLLLSQYHKSFIERRNPDASITSTFMGAVEKLVRRQLHLIIRKRTQWSLKSWYDSKPWSRPNVDLDTSPACLWMGLSPFDWERIIRSIFLLRFDAKFCVNFGSEIITLESMLSACHASLVSNYIQFEDRESAMKCHVQREINRGLVNHRPASNGVNAYGYPLPPSLYPIPPSSLTPVPASQRTVLPGGCPGMDQVMDGCIDENGAFVPGINRPTMVLSRSSYQNRWRIPITGDK